MILNITQDNVSTELKRKNYRFEQLNGHKVRVNYFTYPLIAKGTKNKNGSFDSLGYHDGEMLKILSKSINFTIDFVEATDGITYGFEYKKGAFNGALGLIQEERVDMLGNSRLTTDADMPNLIRLTPFTTTKIHFVISKKTWNEINLMKSFLQFFDWRTKLLMLMTFIMVPLFATLVNISKELKCMLIKNYLTAIGIMFSVSTKHSGNWPTRFLFGSFTLLWLILSNTYSSKIIEFLNNDIGLRNIESLSELYKSHEVRVPASLINLLGDSDNTTSKLNNPIQRRIREVKAGKGAFITYDDFQSLLLSKKYAVLCIETTVKYLTTIMCDDEGDDLITHIKETPYEFYVGLAVNRALPITQQINEITRRAFEAGIMRYEAGRK